MIPPLNGPSAFGAMGDIRRIVSHPRESQKGIPAVLCDTWECPAQFPRECLNISPQVNTEREIQKKSLGSEKTTVDLRDPPRFRIMTLHDTTREENKTLKAPQIGYANNPK